MMLGHRSHDAVVTICQNNSKKSIEITAINKSGEEMLGYLDKEIVGMNLVDILPPRIGTMLSEYVEYEEGANDVGQVLSKVQSFTTLGKDGKETGFRLKVVRSIASSHQVFFELVLQDKTGLRKNAALRQAIQENFRGHAVLDPSTGMPDRNSLNKDIELMGYYSKKSDVRSSFAILQLDHYDELLTQYGRTTCHTIVAHITSLCRKSLRPDDVVGTVNYKRIGVLLMDASIESARMAVNRLRWQIAANPYNLPDRSSIGLSVSIAFCRIGGRLSDKSILDGCDDALEHLGAGAINVLTEVDDMPVLAGANRK
jgi:diguanylate cyclase (GGDEF)-like protein